MRIITMLLIAVSVALVGCYGTADEGTGGSTAALVDVAPLPVVSADSWRFAPAGCEDRLGDVATYGVAEGEPALVVGLSIDGESLCVDALEAVDLELREEGEHPEADELCRRYLAVIESSIETHRETSGVAPRTADPSPQPNLGAVTIHDKGDPSPQPNLEGTMQSEEDKTSSDATGNRSTGSTGTPTRPRRTDPGPEEGDPSPQPNSQPTMQGPAPAATTTE